jgi:hypothetical protein
MSENYISDAELTTTRMRGQRKVMYMVLNLWTENFHHILTCSEDSSLLFLMANQHAYIMHLSAT